MKAAGEPMSLQEVAVLLKRASEVSNHRRFVIAGSLVATGAVVRAPADMVMSRDLDFYPQLDPGRGFLEIAEQLGENSAFHRENGYYADPISPAILALPAQWESRLAPISLEGGVIAFFIDPNDTAIGKLMRGEDNDSRWVRAGLIEGVLNAEVIRERARTVHNAQASEMTRLQTLLSEIERAIGDATPTPAPPP